MYGSSRRHRSMVLSVGGQSYGFWKLLPHVLSQEFFACSLQGSQRSLVDVGEAPLAVHGDEGVGDAFQDVRDALAGLPRLLRGPLALGDVYDEFHPHFVIKARRGEQSPPAGAVLADVFLLVRDSAT